MDASTLIKKYLINKSGNLESTGCMPVSMRRVLYNVQDSTHDPKIHSWSWKYLLEYYLKNATCCYVNEGSPPVSGDTHPQFNVGGHVCTDYSRTIPPGGECYLMPLCTAHNNSDEYKFTSHPPTILQLFGYMQGEPAFTFMAREKSDIPYSLVFSQNGSWHHQNINNEEMLSITKNQSLENLGYGDLEEFILLERINKGKTSSLVVKDSRV